MRKIALISIAAVLFPVSFIRGEDSMTGDASLFLNLQKVGLAALDDSYERNEFLKVVSIEKQKLQYQMLQNVYDSAFNFYRQGNYEEAKALSERILAIDPNFEDAAMLMDASAQLKDKPRPFLSKKILIEDRFKLVLSLYREGRVLEAYDKMEEVVKLSPNNIKAKYWLERIRGDLKDYYFSKGKELYQKHDLEKALENYYNALLLKQKDPRVMAEIAKTEEELRDKKANETLKKALEYYAEKKLLSTWATLKKVLEIKPSDAKAAKLLEEVRAEIEKGYIAAGRKYYSRRKYDSAIAMWKKAKPYASSVSYINKLIARTRQQIKREEEEKKRMKAEAERKRLEEERKRKEAEAKKKQEEITEGPITEKPEGVSQANRISSQKHYLEGLKYFQNSNYQKARNKWTIAKQLDPENADAQMGLKRIEQILSGGR